MEKMLHLYNWIPVDVFKSKFLNAITSFARVKSCIIVCHMFANRRFFIPLSFHSFIIQLDRNFRGMYSFTSLIYSTVTSNIHLI